MLGAGTTGSDRSHLGQCTHSLFDYHASLLPCKSSNVSSASVIIVIIIFIFFLFSAGDQTQGLIHARQMLLSIELHSLVPREVLTFFMFGFLDSLAV